MLSENNVNVLSSFLEELAPCLTNSYDAQLKGQCCRSKKQAIMSEEWHQERD